MSLFYLKTKQRKAKEYENLSLAFNGNNNRCLCIMSRGSNNESDAALNSTTIPDDRCDRYCDNILGNSKAKQTFKCGSLTDSRIWTRYNLISECPIGSIYVKKIGKCMFTHRGLSSSCPSPSIRYVYNEIIKWNAFLKLIEKLNLTKSIVSINFASYVTINPLWKCPTTIATTNTTNSNWSNTDYFSRKFSTFYVLENGCLRARSYSLHSRMLTNHLCIRNSNYMDSSSADTRINLFYLPIRFIRTAHCPSRWFDLNGHCYRMSDGRKTIQEAKNSCINLSGVELKFAELQIIYNNDADNNDTKKEINKYMDFRKSRLKGKIAQYTSTWERDLGFFLLDTSKLSKKNLIYFLVR